MSIMFALGSGVVGDPPSEHLPNWASTEYFVEAKLRVMEFEVKDAVAKAGVSACAVQHVVDVGRLSAHR